MPAMVKAERERFLAEPRIGALSVARPDAPPLSVPVWYRYEPGGQVVVQTGPESLKFRLLDAAREFTLLVQTEQSPYRYVSVSGPVVAIEGETPWEEVEAMAARYFDGEALAGFLKTVEDRPVATVRMRPERWNSTDYS